MNGSINCCILSDLDAHYARLTMQATCFVRRKARKIFTLVIIAGTTHGLPNEIHIERVWLCYAVGSLAVIWPKTPWNKRACAGAKPVLNNPCLISARCASRATGSVLAASSPTATSAALRNQNRDHRGRSSGGYSGLSLPHVLVALSGKDCRPRCRLPNAPVQRRRCSAVGCSR